jgi:SnoaL-like domain
MQFINSSRQGSWDEHLVWRTVMDSSDDAEIRNTLARFCRLLDDRRFPEVGELFAPHGRMGRTAGREQIVELLGRGGLARSPDLFRKHMTGNMVVDVGPVTAAAESDLVMFERLGASPWELRMGVYRDTLERIGGRWLFTDRQLTWTANGLR